MITILYDPNSRYVIDKKFIRIDYTQLPKSYNTSTEIHQILLTKNIDDSQKFVVIDGVDKLDEKKSALLTRILLSAPSSTNILLIAENEHKVSTHILNIGPVVKRLRGTPQAKEVSIWQKLKIAVQTHRVPGKDELLLLFKSIGDTHGINEHNRELACDLDKLLFKTDSKYLAVAWAGLHKKQNVRLRMVSTKKKEKKKKLKPKIQPTKMKRAKKAMQQSLEDWL